MAIQKTKPTTPTEAPAATTPPKPVDSLKFQAAQRQHIPSREEAGQEQDALQGRPTVKNIALNPVTSRGQDPELYWMHKYATDDAQTALPVDIRSLYRHEHIAPEKLIARLYTLKDRPSAQNELFTSELFGNPLTMDELDKPGSYYHHPGTWQNRLVQGDSLLVMTSLLEREGMAGQVQCVYMDPPYGIKYGSNWQMRLNDRNVKDGADENLSGEPEVIKAFRDTWELGIHSYLSYLRDRLLVAKELLSASGSCFVQISDENVHLVRCLMDEVFGSENFVSQIAFVTTTGFSSNTLATLGDHLVWYAKDKSAIKYRRLYEEQSAKPGDNNAGWVLLPDGSYRGVTASEKRGEQPVPEGARLFNPDNLQSQGSASQPQPFEFDGKIFNPASNSHWKANYPIGMNRLAAAGRLQTASNSLRYRRFASDFPFKERGNIWTDTLTGSFTDEKVYVVQTNRQVIARCILMTTDPGDLVLDPTCGSGTSAYVAEQWGRRWITSDTSRIALNIAKTRLMTATFPWYKLADTAGNDIRHGFIYKTVPHVTLKSLANDEPPDTETLYDQPEQDKKRMRVTGPFTVETLQSFEPLAPEQLGAANSNVDNVQRFTERIFEHLKTAGIKNGAKNETAIFNRVDIINDLDGALHAEGWYKAQAEGGAATERKAYLHIGPQFGTVSKAAVNAAIKACRGRADADWLVILGFGFESDVDNRSVTLKVGSFEVTKARMHDDLMQDGLIKKDKKAASFVTIGEPDIALLPCAPATGLPLTQSEQAKAPGPTGTGVPTLVQVEIKGLDIYDPVKDEVKARSRADISYWMVDEAYDGANFVASQVFFCGGEADEFDKFKRGLQSLAAASAKKAAERTLKIELDDEAFARLYGFVSHPITVSRGQRVAVRVISQFGEESTKVLVL